jgi:hypothetical protein
MQQQTIGEYALSPGEPMLEHAPKAFDGTIACKQVLELIRQVGRAGRIVLDFSGVGPVNAGELSHLLAGMAVERRLVNTEIELEGLRVSNTADWAEA